MDYELTNEQSSKLAEWQKVSKELSDLKVAEMRLRNEIVDSIVEPDMAEGSRTLAIGNGWKMKVSRKQNYNVSAKHVDALLFVLPEDLGDALIRYKPELSLSIYRSALSIYRNTLPADQQAELTALVVDAVTITPGAPSLELVAPKSK